MRHEDTYLIINFQRSSSKRSFYINGGISYTELLSSDDQKHSPITAFNSEATKFPIHVDFRAENIPNAPVTQAEIDKIASSHDAKAIENIIHTAIESIIFFFYNHGSRAEVRKLKYAKLFSAIIRSNV
jgi:hypothetical protein